MVLCCVMTFFSLCLWLIATFFVTFLLILLLGFLKSFCVESFDEIVVVTKYHRSLLGLMLCYIWNMKSIRGIFLCPGGM